LTTNPDHQLMNILQGAQVMPSAPPYVLPSCLPIGELAKRGGPSNRPERTLVAGTSQPAGEAKSTWRAAGETGRGPRVQYRRATSWPVQPEPKIRAVVNYGVLASGCSQRRIGWW